MPVINKLVPMWQTTDKETVRLFHGDVLKTAQKLPGQSVQCIVTSPPYFALRDYGTGSPDELGSEKTPEEYITKMVLIFRELKRVLRNDGTVWLNLGDSYSSSPTGHGGKVHGTALKGRDLTGIQSSASFDKVSATGLDSGNLIGIPWRVALALQADGWMLRQDIIWDRVNPMPESVESRCTKAHEYIFLLTKSMNYYYDAEAIKEELAAPPHNPGNKQRNGGERCQPFDNSSVWQDPNRTWGDSGGKNKRSVWSIPSSPYPGAHYATFPPKLIEPCILAGTSEYGCCVRCGEPYKRIVERRNPVVKNAEQLKRDRSAENRNGKGDSTLDGEIPTVDTVGWEKPCICTDDNWQPITDVVPCTVLDPFCGAGTSIIVSLKHGRRSWGIELSKQYILLNQIPRIEGQLMCVPDTRHLVPLE